ncbi:hypothetical protein ACQP1O_17155 [Nocardia sp. CA-151230]|uniref:hypothetical protein n=1 Tax=Nocardia sp. CA-151230 TaxID=3239982 RepID=UPI003D8F5ECA
MPALHHPEARAEIEAWVTQHLPEAITVSRPGIAPIQRDIDTPNTLTLLTDEELAQHIETITRRLAPTDTEALLYGPAHPTVEAPSNAENDWLVDEFNQLQREQLRRSHLTAAETETEHHIRSHAARSEPETSAPDASPPLTITPNFSDPAADL